MEPKPGARTKSARTMRVMTENRKQEGLETCWAVKHPFRIRKDVKGFWPDLDATCFFQETRQGVIAVEG